MRETIGTVPIHFLDNLTAGFWFARFKNPTLARIKAEPTSSASHVEWWKSTSHCWDTIRSSLLYGQRVILVPIFLKMKPTWRLKSIENAMEPFSIAFSQLNWRMLAWTTFGTKKKAQHAMQPTKQSFNIFPCIRNMESLPAVVFVLILLWFNFFTIFNINWTEVWKQTEAFCFFFLMNLNFEKFWVILRCLKKNTFVFWNQF